MGRRAGGRRRLGYRHPGRPDRRPQPGPAAGGGPVRRRPGAGPPAGGDADRRPRRRAVRRRVPGRPRRRRRRPGGVAKLVPRDVHPVPAGRRRRGRPPAPEPPARRRQGRPVAGEFPAGRRPAGAGRVRRGLRGVRRLPHVRPGRPGVLRRVRRRPGRRPHSLHRGPRAGLRHVFGGRPVQRVEPGGSRAEGRRQPESRQRVFGGLRRLRPQRRGPGGVHGDADPRRPAGRRRAGGAAIGGEDRRRHDRRPGVGHRGVRRRPGRRTSSARTGRCGRTAGGSWKTRKRYYADLAAAGRPAAEIAAVKRAGTTILRREVENSRRRRGPRRPDRDGDRDGLPRRPDPHRLRPAGCRGRRPDRAVRGDRREERGRGVRPRPRVAEESWRFSPPGSSAA